MSLFFLFLSLIDILSDNEIEEILKIYNNSDTTTNGSVKDTTTGEVLVVNKKMAAILQEENHNILKRVTQRLNVSLCNFLLFNG